MQIRFIKGKKQLNLERKDFFYYYDGSDEGTAIKLKDFFPIDLNYSEIQDLNIKIPQSFCYLSKDTYKKLVNTI